MDILASEYGYTKEDVFKLTLREISDMIEALVARKSGVKKEVVETKIDKEKEDKVKKLIEEKLRARMPKNE